MSVIKSLREKASFTQNQLAEKLNVTQSTVAMWESGVNTPNADNLKNLADVLHCSTDEILGRIIFENVKETG